MTAFESAENSGRELIVSFADTANRMRRFAVALGGLTLALVVLRAVTNAGLSGQMVTETIGLVLLLALFGEVVIVGAVTIRGARRAAKAGQRLSQGDVALVPPQVGRWLNRRFNAPGPQSRS